jgi:hypothetical protein
VGDEVREDELGGKNGDDRHLEKMKENFLRKTKVKRAMRIVCEGKIRKKGSELRSVVGCGF